VRTVVAFVEADGVERVSAGLHADPPEDVLLPAVLQCHAVDEHFGDGPQGEQLAGITDIVDLAAGGREADAEPGPLLLRKIRRLVAEDLAVVQRQVTPVQLLQPIVYPSSDAVG
jgi:hypothetical protein